MIIEKEHYKIIAYKNLIHFTPIHSWNEVVVKQVMKDMERMAQMFSGKKWAILNDAQNWELHTQDAEKFAKNSLKEGVLAGLTYNAVVVGESALKEWQTQNIFKNKSHFETKIFTTLKEALDWLESLGYTMISLDE